MPEEDYQKMINVLTEVSYERKRQDTKWGQQNRKPGQYSIVLHEEVGEAAKEICEAEFTDNEHARLKHFKNLRTELLQVAAVAVAMIECLDRNELKPAAQHVNLAPLPTTLDEAVNYFLPRFAGATKWPEFGNEDAFASMCHSVTMSGIGMSIRNELKLWVHESPLHQHFLTEHYLFHSDEMSDLIIRKIHQHLIKEINQNEELANAQKDR